MSGPMGWHAVFRWIADDPHRSVGERAAAERCMKASEDAATAALSMEVAAVETAGAMRDFMATWVAGDARMTLDEAEEVAQHPDLAELNVMLDGYYGARP